MGDPYDPASYPHIDIVPWLEKTARQCEQQAAYLHFEGRPFGSIIASETAKDIRAQIERIKKEREEMSYEHECGKKNPIYEEITCTEIQYHDGPCKAERKHSFSDGKDKWSAKHVFLWNPRSDTEFAEMPYQEASYE